LQLTRKAVRGLTALQSFRETEQRLPSFSHEVLLERDASSHRFQGRKRRLSPEYFSIASSQPCAQFFLSQAFDANHFVARLVTAQHNDCSRWNFQQVSEKNELERHSLFLPALVLAVSL